MRKARPVLPTDLLALVSYNGRVYPNEAKARERLGAADANPKPIETAFEQWFSFATGRNAWISARRGRLQGLVSARRRGSRQAWEIDCLIDTTLGLDTLPGLLDCATGEAGRSGAEKLFLRLSTTSDFLPVVRSAGFQPYCVETLYVLESPLSGEFPALALREFSRQDLYPAFRLYSTVHPESRRRSEAATFGEWQACLERHWLKGGVQLVHESRGLISAWIGAARLPQGLLVDLLAEEVGAERVAGLVLSAAKATAGRLPFFALAPRGGGVAASLEALGFRGRSEFTSLVYRTTRVARLPHLVPAIAKTAVVT